MSVVSLFFFFFFKQKTAYEMRISDWSSDVCSSDLLQHFDNGVVEPVSLLTEQHGSRRIDSDENGDCQHYRGKEDEQAEGEQPVLNRLGDVAPARQRPPGDLEEALAGYAAHAHPGLGRTGGGRGGWDVGGQIRQDSEA